MKFYLPKVLYFLPLIIFSVPLFSFSFSQLLGELGYRLHLLKRVPPSQPQKTKIALIHLVGEITEAEKYVKQLLQCYDPTIQGVIIHVNSGGGQPGSSATIYNEVTRLKQIKPIITLVENVSASGAYLATCETFIIAPFLSAIGSIGALWQQNFSSNQKFNQNGIEGDLEYVTLTGGKFKAAGDSHVPLTEEHKKYIENRLITLYNEFARCVSIARNISLAELETWGDGQIFAATRALELKLIDMLGGYSDALDMMKKFIIEKGIECSEELDVIEIQ